MGAYLRLLVRASAATAVIAASLAIIVGRLAPPRRADRYATPTRYAAISGHFFESDRTTTRVLDKSTGQVQSLALPDGQRLRAVSFSDWVDADGQHELVGTWSKIGGSGEHTVCEGTGLARIAFPSGRILDQVNTLAMMPSSPPCWYPGQTARVLYAGGDGRLYQFAFESDDETRHAEGERSPVPITWGDVPAARGSVWVFDVYWPKDPRFGGRLFASITVDTKPRAEKTLGPARIWWLQLSADGMQVEAGGPLGVDDSPEDHPLEQRFARATTLRDGGAALAYQRRLPGERATEVRVVRLEMDHRGGELALRVGQSVRIAVDCKPVPAEFTPDGNAVFVFFDRERPDDCAVRRVPLPEVLMPLVSARSPLADDTVVDGRRG